MVLLHHFGARSGTERVNPLVYVPDGHDMVVAATKSGSPTNPDWYHNLKAHPRIRVEVGRRTVPVEAIEVTGGERDDLWHRADRPTTGNGRIRNQNQPRLPDVPTHPGPGRRRGPRLRPRREGSSP